MNMKMICCFLLFTSAPTPSPKVVIPLPEGFDGVHLGMNWASLISLRGNVQVLSLMPDTEEALTPDPEAPREGLTERLPGPGPFDKVLYAFENGLLVGMMFGKDIQRGGQEREDLLRFVVEKCGKPSRIALLEKQGHHSVLTWRDEALHVNLVIPTDKMTSDKRFVALQIMDREYAERISALGSPTKPEEETKQTAVDGSAVETLKAEINGYLESEGSRK